MTEAQAESVREDGRRGIGIRGDGIRNRLKMGSVLIVLLGCKGGLCRYIHKVGGVGTVDGRVISGRDIVGTRDGIY